MNKSLWLCCLFLVACMSCVGSFQPVSLDPAPEREQAYPKESADNACSYYYFLRGQMAADDGRLDEAREAYEHALVCDSRAEYIMQNLAILLVKMGKKQQAAVWLGRIRALQPEDTETLLLLANLYSAMDESEKAVNLYQHVLHKDPANFNALLLLGTLHAKNREYEQAQQVLERLVETNPNSYVGYLYLGKLYQEMHEEAEALKSYRRALALNWSEPLALEIAALLEQMEQFQKAVVLYRDVLARDKTSEQARGRLAGVYMQMGKPDLALAELKELRNYAADVQKVDFAIGRLLIEQERYDEAITQFKRLLDEDPSLEAARYLLALIYYEKESQAQAEQLLRQISPDAAMYEDATLLLVKVLEEKQDLAGAEAVLQERLARETTRKPVFYLALAAFYKEHDQVDRSRAVYVEALQRYPEEPRVLFQYGLFLEQTGDSEQAMVQMQKVLQLDPQNPYALNFVGYTWADKGINLDKALEYIQQAVALRPGDGFIRDSLGWVYFQLGQIEKAVNELEAARGLEPDDPNIHEHLGDVYIEAHQLREAVKAYKRAIDLFEDDEQAQEVKRKLEAIQQ